MTDFVALHVHSSFSPGWGVHGVEELCAAARAMGLRQVLPVQTNSTRTIVALTRRWW